MTEEPKKSPNKRKQRNINEEEIEVGELSNDDIPEINDNNNDDSNDDDDNDDEDKNEDESEDSEEAQTNVTVTQSAKKRQRASTDDVTNITPRKRNKTNPNRLTIQLDQPKYTNIKNTVKNNLMKIHQLVHQEVGMEHKPEITVKLKVIIEKMEDIFAPIDAAFIKKNK
jgi:cobalamin biosynthesis protein CobT